MTYLGKPKFHHPSIAVNELGYTRRDYEGSMSTLCAGCGHDAISAAIIHACFELSLPPHRIAKLSGIGCSSKTPTYMLGQSHGFNSVHGRMPSVLTGANLANRDLIYLGVSGDGDTASIGLGQFAHSMRRGVNMVYIVENNGVYGLTKGQFSATADRGSKSKKGAGALDQPIDLVGMAIGLGASFVGRSFSGDKAQLVPLIKAAFEHKGAAFIDVLSPCVTFNNHAGSTKSFDYVREHNIAVNALDVITGREPIEVDYAEGGSQAVTMHDGSTIVLRKLDANHDCRDRSAALATLERARIAGEIATGLIYIDDDANELHEILGTTDRPLNELSERELCPGSKALGRDQCVAEVETRGARFAPAPGPLCAKSSSIVRRKAISRGLCRPARDRSPRPTVWRATWPTSGAWPNPTWARVGWVYFPMTVARARCHQPLRRGRGGSVAAGATSAAESACAGAEDSTIGSGLVAPGIRAPTSTSCAAATRAGSAIVSL